jgi:hypothetical protein
MGLEMHNLQAGEHMHCLDMLRVESASGSAHPFHECAILLEIWDSGGLLQTSMAIPEETIVSIPSVANGLSAKVVSCEQDDYGFLVKIAVSEAAWFPERYTPSYIMPPLKAVKKAAKKCA